MKESHLNAYYILAVGIVSVLFVHLPFFILGEQTYLSVHDNLDSDFIYNHILKISGQLFNWDSDAPVRNVFNGLPRSYFHSEYSFVRVLFYFLPSFWAYAINSVFVRVLAFVGICLLARDYFHLRTSKDLFLVFLFASIFALLPGYTIYGASVYGQALLLWAFLNLLHKQKQAISFVLVGLFPFYSHFILVGIFVIAGFVLVGIVRLFLFKKALSWSYVLAGGLLVALFIIANHSLLSTIFFSAIPMHRDEIVLPSNTFVEVLNSIFLQFSSGLQHSGTLITLPLSFLIFYVLVKYKKGRQPLALLFTLIIAIIVFDNLYRPFVSTFLSDITLFQKVQLNRFGMLLPTCWILLVLQLIKNNVVKPIWVGLAIVLLVPFSRLPIFELGVNWIRLLTNIEYVEKKYPGFKVYYSPDLFEEVQQHINQPKENYKVVSVGMHPAVALYNGFHTLDSYQNIYPLRHKKQFRKFIAKELDKNETLQTYFDDWGHRCYIFSDTLKKTCYLECHKNVGIGPVDVDLNVEELRKNNVQYIFSAVALQNKVIPLVLDKVFENDKSRWKIYLYKI
ncbi:MAG: DUF6044 family protein [Aureispira sp.]